MVSDGPVADHSDHQYMQSLEVGLRRSTSYHSGNAFNKDYTFAGSRKSTCTTADITEDKSNYWTPQLMRKQEDGSFRIAPLKRANMCVPAMPLVLIV